MLIKNLAPVVTVISVKIESHMPLKENKNPKPILHALQETQSSCQYTLGKSFLKEMLRNTIFNYLGFFQRHQAIGPQIFKLKYILETKLTECYQETKTLCKKHPKKRDFNSTSLKDTGNEELQFFWLMMGFNKLCRIHYCSMPMETACTKAIWHTSSS